MKNHRLPLQAGQCKVDITPTEEELKSFCEESPNKYQGIRQHIYSRILVLQSGTRRVLIVGNDLIDMPDYYLLRDCLVDLYGFKPTDIILGGTQNHLSPVVNPPRADGKSRPAIYLSIRDKIHNLVIQGVGKAIERLKPARIGWSSCNSGINIQKDMLTQAGMIIGNQYFGYADKELFMLRVDAEDGTPIAALLNYGVQGGFMFTKENCHICGDLPGTVSELLETYIGGDFIAPYIIGAAGDMAPVVTANFQVLRAEQGKVVKEEHALPLDAREMLLAWLAGQQFDDAVRLYNSIYTDKGDVFFRSGEIFTDADARVYPVRNPHDDPHHRDVSGTLTHRIHMLSISDELVFVCGNSITSARLGRMVKDSLPCKTVYISVEGGIVGYVIDTQADPIGFGAMYSPAYSARESENVYINSTRELFHSAAD